MAHNIRGALSAFLAFFVLTPVPIAEASVAPPPTIVVLEDGPQGFALIDGAALQQAHDDAILRLTAIEEAQEPSAPVPAPRPVATPTPAPEPAVASCGGWEALVAQYFPDETAKACAVLLCESRGNPQAENAHSSASGLWQFIDGTWRSARAMVGADQYARASHAPPEVQTAAAAAWKNATSWEQWECHR